MDRQRGEMDRQRKETDRQRAGWSAILDGRAASELDGPAAIGDGRATGGGRLGKERRRAGKIEVGAPVKRTNGECSETVGQEKWEDHE
jgi:hypothetical protein